jgi:glycosyltransferase involved in cell wall biosynthesis
MVTVYMPVYNQEAYVRYALGSVLSQDFEPLTIFISDDASTDATVAIVNEELGSYRGPHSVVFNQNEENLFLDHLVVNLPKLPPGLVVMAHGDDIQYPNRVSSLVALHERTGALVLSSNALVIDSEGKELRMYDDAAEAPDLSLEAFLANGYSPVGTGFSIAWHSDIWEIFGPKRKGTRPVDDILSFRAALLDKRAYISEPLLQWRNHDRNVTLAIQLNNAGSEREAMLIRERILQKQVSSWTSHVLDVIELHKAGVEIAHYDDVLLKAHERLLHFNLQYMEFRKDMLDQGIGIA